MKKYILAFLLIIVGFTSSTQTATNFTCDDCLDGTHDLFSELDNGKVIVLCWVMPCATCIAPSKTAYNIVNSFQTSHPNRVFFYLVDDFADTPCSSLNSWANSNAMPESAFSLRFVNSTISMTDYGSAGMPKIVVLGGGAHTVFYNVISTVNAVNLQKAINDALAAGSGVEDLNSALFSVSLFSDLSDSKASLSVNLKSLSNITVDLYNVVGKKVTGIYDGKCNTGNNEIKINTAGFSNGIYFVKVSVADRTKILKLVISN